MRNIGGEILRKHLGGLSLRRRAGQVILDNENSRSPTIRRRRLSDCVNYSCMFVAYATASHMAATTLRSYYAYRRGRASDV